METICLLFSANTVSLKFACTSIEYVGNTNLLATKSHTVYFSCGSKEFKRPITLICCDAMTSKQIFHRKIAIFPSICDFPKMKNCDQRKINTTFDLYFYSESNSDASLSIPLRDSFKQGLLLFSNCAKLSIGFSHSTVS